MTSQATPQPGREPRLRLFVAIELPGAWLRALAAIQQELSLKLEQASGSVKPRWVRPEGIHLTLKFLGEVEASRRPVIDAALAEAVPASPGLSLRLASVGTFGDRGSPRVIWVGLQGDTEGLARLAGRVDAAMAPLGFPAERRPFAPHLTLARIPDPVPLPDRERFIAAIRSLSLPAVPALEARAVSLMQSHLGRGGARYELLRSFPLPER